MLDRPRRATVRECGPRWSGCACAWPPACGLCCLAAVFLVSCYSSREQDAEDSLPGDAAAVDSDRSVTDASQDDVPGEGDDGTDDGTCTWTGEYVRAVDGSCRFQRDGLDVEAAPDDCCRYRPCQYACGPCIPFDECGMLDPTYIAWCPCSTLGPPSLEADPLFCDPPVTWAASRGGFLDVVARVDAPWEADAAAYREIADRYCGAAGGYHLPMHPPTEDGVAVSFHFEVCSWQVARDLQSLPGVHWVRIPSDDWSDWPVPPCP